MPISLKDASNTAIVYDNYRIEGSRAEYHGTEHSDLNSDALILTATSPKKTNTSNGNRRSTIKVVRTFAVPGTESGVTEKKDAKCEISFSIPVGAATEVIAELIARGRSALETTDISTDLLEFGKIQH